MVSKPVVMRTNLFIEKECWKKKQTHTHTHTFFDHQILCGSKDLPRRGDETVLLCAANMQLLGCK